MAKAALHAKVFLVIAGIAGFNVFISEHPRSESAVRGTDL
jgi:arginine exporter protein ArgO